MTYYMNNGLLLVPVMATMMGLGVGCGDSGTGGTGGGGGESSGAIKVQVSGEELAPDGFLFPTGSEVTIADGWELKFDHVLVSIGKVEIANNPDNTPTDQSKTGEIVARLDGGPWLVDLAKEGSEPGAGGEGKGVLLGIIENQNLKDGDAFATDERYALSYATVAPTSGSAKVNLDAATDPYVADMSAKGYVVMFVGTATFKGTACESSDLTYFDTFPTEVKFALGFKTPTSYINCQNAENQGDPFDGEEYQRGIPISASGESLAQLTFHVDHPFYADFAEEPALFFDQYAAAIVGKPAGTVLTMEDLTTIDPTAMDDASGAALPWRVCDGSALPPGAQRGFGVASVPVNPAGDPSMAIRHYADYASYVQSTQGHLNGGEGLCFIERNYPSPQ